MDWIAVSGKIMDYIKKYRYVLLVLAAGIILMALPEKKAQTSDSPQPAETAQQLGLQESLEELLSQMEGAGKVRVLLTQARGEQVLYQTNEDTDTAENSSQLRVETVILSGSDRGETGLVQQVNPPEYLGAVVLCQGAGNAAVRLSVVEAVMSATGLTSDKITVLIMK